MIRKIQSVVIPESIAIFIAIIFVVSSSIITASSFAPSDSGNNHANQTMQNIGQSANQTGEHVQQDANQTSEVIQGNATDVGSNTTEGVKSLGKNLTEVAKKIGETISKKLQDLAK